MDLTSKYAHFIKNCKNGKLHVLTLLNNFSNILLNIFLSERVWADVVIYYRTGPEVDWKLTGNELEMDRTLTGQA